MLSSEVQKPREDVFLDRRLHRPRGEGTGGERGGVLLTAPRGSPGSLLDRRLRHPRGEGTGGEHGRSFSQLSEDHQGVSLRSSQRERWDPRESLFSRWVVSDSATPWTAARQASLSITNSQSLLKLVSIESVMPSNHLILCLPLLLLPSIFPGIRVFFNELALCNRWLKYRSFKHKYEVGHAVVYRSANFWSLCIRLYTVTY